MFPMPPPKLCGCVPAYRFLRRVPFRSIPSAPPPAWAPPGGGPFFARVSCGGAPARGRARLAPARFAHLIARARRRAHVSLRKAGRGKTPAALRLPPSPPFARGSGAVHGSPCIVSCFVMFPMPPVMLCGSVPAYRSLRRVPFRSLPSAPPPARAPSSGGTLFCARILRARPRPPARLAPARFAHLIARARRRTHPAPSAPAEAFFASSSHCFPAQKSGKAAPEAASLCRYCSTLFLRSSPLEGQI